VVAAAIWLLHSRLAGRGFDWRIFRATLAGLRWGWLVAACAALLAGYFGRALRWRALMRPVKAHPHLGNLFSATIIGFAAGTLFGVPGEVVRPYLIAAREQVPVSSQMAVWLLERIYDLLIVLAMFGFALGYVRRSDVLLGPELSWVFATGGWFVAVLSVLMLALLVGFRHFSSGLRRRLLAALRALPEKHRAKADRAISAFIQGVESTRSDRALLLVIWYTVCAWATIALTTFCIMQAFGGALRFGWLDVLIFLGFLAFGAVVRIPGIGGGVQVVATLVLTQLFRVPSEIAVSVALVFWIISFVVVVPFGMLLALHEGIRWSSLKALEPEVTA